MSTGEVLEHVFLNRFRESEVQEQVSGSWTGAAG